MSAFAIKLPSIITNWKVIKVSALGQVSALGEGAQWWKMLMLSTFEIMA